MPRFPAAAETSRFVSHRVFFQKLAERLKDHQGALYPLHIGDTWLEPLAEARVEARQGEPTPGLYRYSPVHGEKALIDAVVGRMRRRTGRTMSPDTLQVTSGATSGLSVTCQTLLDPGDEVIIPAPFWPLIRGIVASRGARAVQLPFFDRLDDPAFDLERALESVVTERTVAIYLNSPHNPTGRILDSAQIDAIADFVLRHDLWVISDEVYDDLVLGEQAHQPIWLHPKLQSRTVAVHSMSKAYGLAGARVGYAHGPVEVMRKIRSVNTFQVYCAAKPMQLGCAVALNEGDAWLDNARQHYRDAAQATARVIGTSPPAGGTFLFFDASPWLRASDEDAMPLLLRCLDAGVLLTPGSAMGDAYHRWVRICFTSIGPQPLARALDALAQVLRG